MSFDIKLQRNESENNRMVKTLTEIATYSGTLKADTSIIDPIIIIQCALSDVAYANYMTIASFGRMYFINDIRSIRNDLVQFSCHVDVLSTYAEQLKQCEAIIHRQENEWNLYLNDGSFKVYQNPQILTKAFPSGFTTQELVLAVAGS